MRPVKIAGKNNKHNVILYAICTCPWCKKAKRFLADNEVEYYYVDVDLASKEDYAEIVKDMHSRGGRDVYPTIIVDNTILVTNPDEKKLIQTLNV
jgi:glutaredoxin